MIFSFIWSAAFVSRITAALTRLQILSGQEGAQFAAFRRFLTHHRINSELSFRAMTCAKFFVDQQQRNQPESEIYVLTLLSEPLLIELHYEVHCHVLAIHPFFRRYNHFEPLVMQRLCHFGVSEINLGVGDVLFTEGQEPDNPRMFFVKEGMLLFYKDYDQDGDIDPDEIIKVHEPMWVCEAVMWARWYHHGTLRAATHSTVLSLSSKEFQKVMSEYRQTAYPIQYAQAFVSALNEGLQSGEDVDDVLDIIDVALLTNQIFPHFLAKNNKGTQNTDSSSGSSVMSRVFGRSASGIEPFKPQRESVERLSSSLGNRTMGSTLSNSGMT